ncbi:protein mono-ADP-ribosyltransferase PARP16-like [Anneissia japonica]|uniref:protein mono-ADP-ribosyltransferase PARP16-like n=1 Tax=Anneissia japonica TaxID=1529436 RepID=UPI00142557E5|nr:protein mono-ADP-ribosyltransferase PARP16-like [Anneissia japonica]XP_033096441.1 protein mono-ADP-ribosyltransferase PARP16-like [Anneissia japonica]
MTEELKKILLQRISEDRLACDVIWSLFSAALFSYRHDTVLRPFPSDFIDTDREKDFTNLEAVAKEIPNLKLVLDAIKSNQIAEQAWQLLTWVIDTKTFRLKTQDQEQFQNILELTGAASYEVKPDHVFEVEYCAANEDKFNRLRQSRDLLYAYHGSRLENFYSILHNGLHSHMNKTSLFGEGTYLSSDLSISLPYSPTCKGWQRSLLGESLSCVAVCEMIDHPDVKCQTKDSKSGSKGRTYAANSIGGEVPQKYYVVQNNEVIRVKYLLIFGGKKDGLKVRSVDRRPRWAMWIRKNSFLLAIIFYTLVLLFIGLYNSKNARKFLRKYLL